MLGPPAHGRGALRSPSAVQRAAYLRDGAPSLAARRGDLSRFKAALIARRSAIEEAINTDFGNRSRHETAMMELGGVVQGIDYLERNLRQFMRPTRVTSPTPAFRQQPHRIPAARRGRRHLAAGTIPSTCR